MHFAESNYVLWCCFFPFGMCVIARFSLVYINWHLFSKSVKHFQLQFTEIKYFTHRSYLNKSYALPMFHVTSLHFTIFCYLLIYLKNIFLSSIFSFFFAQYNGFPLLIAIQILCLCILPRNSHNMCPIFIFSEFFLSCFAVFSRVLCFCSLLHCVYWNLTIYGQIIAFVT